MNVETRKYAVSSTRQRAVEALCVPELADIVDLVTWVEDHDGEPTAYAANHVGWVRLHPGGRHEVVHGHDPILSEDPMAYLPYPIEIAEPSPATSHENSYPYAAERILSLFADPERSPDLAIVHTPRHFFPDEGGHVGEHGSLDVIQSRAPLILSGKGIRRKRFVDAHARLVDVGPTLAYLSGVPEDRLRDDAGAATRRERAADVPHRRVPAGGRGRALGRRAVRRRAVPGRERPAAQRGAAHPARGCAAGRRGGPVPQRDADQPHVDPHRGRSRSARSARQRLCRPHDR